MDLSRPFGGITTVGRPVDLRRASNRLAMTAAVAFTVVATLATLLATDAGLAASLWRGLATGLGAFLAWAIGRELDPDHPAAARDAVLAYVLVAVTGAPEVVATAAVLVAVRILARTTGRAPTRLDLAGLIVVAGLAGQSSVGLVTGTALATAMWLDARADGHAPEGGEDGPPTLTPELIAAAVAFVATFGVTLVSGAFLGGWRGPTPLEGVVVLAAAIAAARLRTGVLTATGDLTREPLDPARIRRGQQAAGATLVVAFLWSGAAAIPALGPLAAALIGAGTAAWRRRPEPDADPASVRDT
jgi:hypothetical protein